jgi:hypothetical protein
MASGIKSKPVYAPLRADTSGRHHLMLGRGAGRVALQRVIAELQSHSPALLQCTRVLFVPDRIDSSADLAALRESGSPEGLSSGPGDVRAFDSTDALLAEYRALLEQAVMGTRVYVAGPENFIGRVLQIALEFNLNKDEIRAEEAGSLARRCWCVHCRTTTSEVRTNIVRCTGCGRWLLVRDHYSRRLAAYMGVMADAEAPGELPAIQEIFV